MRDEDEDEDDWPRGRRMDRERDDDYGGDGGEDFTEPVTFPAIVRVAGIIWLCVGGLSTLNMAAAFLLGGVNNAGVGAGPGCCPGLVAGVVAFAFLHCGYQTVTGKAKDTLGNGIGSIVLGLLQLAGALLIGVGGVLAQNQGANGPPPEVLMAVAVVAGVLGAALVLAGILALAGRSRYREWREVNAPPPKRRRRPRRERDDADDEE